MGTPSERLPWINISCCDDCPFASPADVVDDIPGQCGLERRQIDDAGKWLAQAPHEIRTDGRLELPDWCPLRRGDIVVGRDR